MQEDFAIKNKPRVDPSTLRRLMPRSDWQGGLQLGSHLLALGFSSYALWITWGSLWAIPFFMLQGLLINWLYAGQHEASHDTAFKTRWLNEWLGRFTGFLLLYPRDFDRWQHLTHHRHTQDPELDGELAGRDKEDPGKWGLVLDMTGISLCKFLGASLLRHAVLGQKDEGSEYYLSDEEEKQVVREARWHLAAYLLIAVVSIASGSWAAVIFWIAPTVVMNWTHTIQNTIEHTGMPYIPDTWSNTRTTQTIAPMRWLAWQMVYHTAHHTYPGVPFHRLHELHDEIVKVRGEEPIQMSYSAYWLEVGRELLAQSPAKTI